MGKGESANPRIGAIVTADDAGADGRVALLPLGGAPLVERQIRLLAAQGASPIVLLATEASERLDRLVERLRRESLPVVAAASAAEAAARFGPDDRLLLLDDGVIPAPELLQRASSSGDEITTLPDTKANEAFERIDLERRWAGLLASDGRTLAETVAMLGEWELGSTLLRRMVQAGTPLRSLDETPLRIGEVADAERFAIFEARTAAGRRTDFVAAYLLRPIEEAITDRVADSPLRPAHGLVLTALLCQGCFLAILFGVDWLAAATAILALLPTLVAEQVAARRLVAIPRHHRRIATVFAMLPFHALAFRAFESQDGFQLVIWAMFLLVTFALRRSFAAHSATLPMAVRRWTYSWRAGMLVLAAALLAQVPAMGLSLLALYAAVSFSVVHRWLLEKGEARQAI